MMERNGSLTMHAGDLDARLESEEMKQLMEDYSQIRYVYAAGIRLITARLEALECEFEQKGSHNPIHHVESRVKTLASILKKLDSLGIPQTVAEAKKNLNDIAGVRVVCCYVDDIYKIYNSLISMDDIQLIEKKDYILQPKDNGYRSLHIVVDIPVYLSGGKVYLPVEIQIRTVAMDFWAALEHGIRYKSPSEVPTYINEQLRACADIIASTDDRMQMIFQEIQKLNGEDA